MQTAIFTWASCRRLSSGRYIRPLSAFKEREVLFLCGSDEHGVAITVSAEKEKITPQAIIDRYHPANKSVFEAFEMSFDNYSRTSLPLHYKQRLNSLRNSIERHCSGKKGTAAVLRKRFSVLSRSVCRRNMPEL